VYNTYNIHPMVMQVTIARETNFQVVFTH